jgi:hypothetical protein
MRQTAKIRGRSHRGTSVAEFPVVLGIFLLAVFFPLLDLATIFFGSSSVFSAARVAAVEASRAPTFRNDSTINGQRKLSAIHMAEAKAVEMGTGGVEINASDVAVSVLQVPLNEEGTTATINPTAEFVPDTSANIYQIQVAVSGRVSPMIMLSSFFGHIPGLTEPLVVRAVSTATCEKPDGLAG